MARTVKVWDPVVRIFHWALVASFVVAWLSADDWERMHEAAGYVAGGLIAIRLFWGLVGTRYARFSKFVRSPAVVLGYLKDMLRGREDRFVGHNPAGGAMIVMLILCMAGLCVTGWLYTTDAFWGVEWVEETHELLAHGLLLLIALHIAGVVFASVRHHENLVRAMITGRKRVAIAADSK